MTSPNPDPNGSALNLVLTGFMGTGKSTIGRMIAARLNRPFVDMDVEIERRAGQSIPEIFATRGEEAFRQMERDLCRELAGQRGLVIATGGGALVDPTNRERMIASGIVICLQASPEGLLARLRAEASTRPLLHSDDPAARIRELLAARAEAYDALPYHIDTTDLSPEDVMEAVLTLWYRQFT